MNNFTSPKKTTFRVALFLLFSFLSYNMSAQVTIAYNDFNGNGFWNYNSALNNGTVRIVGNTGQYTGGSTAAPNCIEIQDWWTPNAASQESAIFDQIDISGATGIQFSVDYATRNLSANDELRLIYSIDGGAPVTVVLVQNAAEPNRVFFSDNTNNGTGLPNPYVLNIAAGNTLDITVQGFSDNTGGTESFFIDDIKVTGNYANPKANDDDFAVLVNSPAGPANQINVSPNDAVGSNNGGDGDDYSITIDPLTTANGGTVTEVSDGVFEYVPDTGFIGNDSFDYTICDAGGICDTGTVNIVVNFGACTPTSRSGGSHFITNYSINGENGTAINNASGDNNGYEAFYNVPALEVFNLNNYTGSINVAGDNMGWGIYIDYNRDGDFTDPGEMVASSAGVGTGNLNFTIPNTAPLGKTIMRVGAQRHWSPGSPCGGVQPQEFEDYLIDIKIDSSIAQEIEVIGSSIYIELGAVSEALVNNTNFGLYDILSGALTKSFKIINNGGADLTLNGIPTIEVLDSGDGTYIDFSISDFPDNLVIPSGQEELFKIDFDPSALGHREAIISISSDDPTTPLFQFTVIGVGTNSFADTDGDGVSDNIDQDDDNDGLTDSTENNACLTIIGVNTTELVFLNEDFGSGTSRAQITSGIANATSYCYEDGSGAACSAPWAASSLNDGEYTLHHTVSNGDGVTDPDIDVDIAAWAESHWYSGVDHTPGDTNGRMMIINATEDPGIFYGNLVDGVNANVTINYSFWALNIDRSNIPGIANRVRPQIEIQVYDPSNNLIEQQSTPELLPTTAGNNAGDWVQLSGSFVTPSSSFTFVLVNIQPGGLGNDLAIDDIMFTQTLCDADYDGIADTVDLDNDGDGIPNVVELQLLDSDKDATVFNDPLNPWIDANFNGVHDSYENIVPIDTDGDGIYDYADVDSDNDGIFDTLEYDGFGDVDITGDGVGDGSDDISTDPAEAEQDGDGLLPIIDLNDDGIGNDHGSTAYPTPMDTDGDSIPNYLDLFSDDPTNNPANGSDIANSIYASYDANNDGIIDGTTDVDNDGIIDDFDTDTTVFGSPLDLDDRYTILFDGRNDYVEDAPILGGLANATIMSWVKIEPGASGTRKILGQDNFYLELNASNQVSATANGITTSYGTALSENIWTHVAAIYDSGNTLLKLYINGEEEDTNAVAGSIPADASNFTIGRTSDTDADYFEGQLDEIRIFNKALTEDELQKMVYQELDNTNSFNRGTTIPINIDAGLNASLIRYFKMDGYQDDILDDKSTAAMDSGTGAKMYNIKNIDIQTAPLPYETGADGDWSNSSTWLHGDVWDITDETNNKDWSIVHIKHNTTTANDHTTLGLIVDTNMRLDINNDNELRNTWYLNLNGRIDLKGESQLVQTENSTLNVSSVGRLERDQQGTENLFTYNYWSSPVHSYNPTAPVDGDETYRISQVLFDATDVNNPQYISFTSSLNGNNSSSPIRISNQWIYKFDDRAGDTYSEWQYVGHGGALNVGEGYTMKGPGTGAISNEQNYTFIGRPNNGTITLNTQANNEYLVGNPYPSAIDAYEFILDNPHLDGTLYFWEHYGGGSHVLNEYQGGYGLYNLSGGTPPINGSAATADPDVNSGGSATKIPKRYVPVGQGFFVKADATGDTTFENDQRLFATEAGGNSTFYRNSNDQANNLEDTRRKLRIGYTSPKGYKRQLLLTEDENTSLDADWAFDGPANEESPEDMYWTINENDYIIQAIGSFDEKVKLPLRVKTQEAGIIEINIDSLQYIEDDIKVYLIDNEEVYHNLRNSKYIATINQGVTDNRFEIVFENARESNDIENTTISDSDLNVFFENATNSLTITNPKRHVIKEIQTTNMLGQVVFKSDVNSDLDKIKIPVHLETGSYIFKIITENKILNKKAVIGN